MGSKIFYSVAIMATHIALFTTHYTLTKCNDSLGQFGSQELLATHSINGAKWHNVRVVTVFEE